jgi:hypothetical protein
MPVAQGSAIWAARVDEGTPWAKDGDLSWIGMVYYALRGIEAYLVLGLLVTVIGVGSIMFILTETAEPAAAFTRELRVAPGLRRLGTALLWGAVVGSSAPAIHGIALVLGVEGSGSSAAEELLRAGWPVWMFLAILAFVVALSGIYWLHRHLQLGLERIESDMLASLEPLQAQGNTSKAFQEYWQARAEMRTTLDRVSTWPVSPRAALAVGASAAIQIANVGLGAAKILFESPSG